MHEEEMFGQFLGSSTTDPCYRTVQAGLAHGEPRGSLQRAGPKSTCMMSAGRHYDMLHIQNRTIPEDQLISFQELSILTFRALAFP
jgi:hypothetical protein